MVHCLYKPFHLTFLGYESRFQYFGFNSEPRVSTLALSPPSVLGDGGKRLMGLTWSSPLETYVTVTCFLHSNFGHLVSQSNFSPMASMCLRLSLIGHFFVLGLPSKNDLFRAPSS